MIEISNLSVSRGRKQIIKGLSFALPTQSWVGILGANGSGKTTLLEALSGRHEVDSGSIVIDGLECSHSRIQRVDRISIAPTIESLPSVLSVRQLIKLLSKTESRHARNLRRVLGIECILNKRIGDLSSGYKQRISILAAFLDDCNIVVLDEPFNWLDPVNAYDLKAALKQIVESGVTLLTALHDTATFVQHCDVGLLLDGNGRATEISSAMLQKNRTNAIAFENEIVQRLRESSDRQSISGKP